jgi:signal transduction histidine kinase
VPHSLKTVIYRICQEALNNIAKHSKATLVTLSLRKTNGPIELTVQDNGQVSNVEKIFSMESYKKGTSLFYNHREKTLSARFRKEVAGRAGKKRTSS